jgi:hypothetical protein
MFKAVLLNFDQLNLNSSIWSRQAVAGASTMKRGAALTTTGQQPMTDNDKFTCHHEVYNALREVIVASDPAKRAILKETIYEWSQDDPETYVWAIGPRSPTMLSQIMIEIEMAYEPDATRRVLRASHR